MKEIKISGSGESTIIAGEKLANLKNYLPAGKRIFIITDENVRKLYANKFPEDATVLVIPAGEKSKTPASVTEIFRGLLEMEADRSAFIVGIGGGIVCDLAGFVASTYMRGVDFGFVSTSLLSQVDASVGGKNGVNVDGYKNIMGVFNQPKFVICDFEMLHTLPKEELSCGFAEIAKHVFIADAAMLDFLENNAGEALNLDEEVIEKLVVHSIETKAAIVNSDERESGERRKLNFGHTLAHALEKEFELPHGNAVAIGMVFAAQLSVERGLLSKAECNRLIEVLKKLTLPTSFDGNAEKLFQAMKHDKKRAGDTLHFILLDRLGHAVVEKITYDQLQSGMNTIVDAK